MEMDADQSSRPRPAAGTFRELWQVALPLVLSSGSLSLMHFVDRVFLTWHSTDALAAATPAGVLLWTLMSLAIGTVTYVNTFVAQYDGAGRRERAAAAVWQGVYLAVAAGIPFLLLAPFSDWVFALVGHAPELQPLQSGYFSIQCFGATAIMLSATLSCFYSGRGETMTVLYVNLASVAVNAVLDYALIFGAGPFPEMGVRGASLATVLASAAAAVLFALPMLRSRAAVEYAVWQNRRFDRVLFARLLRYGAPSGVQFFVDIAAFAVFLFLVGRIGTTELAATNLAFNLNTLAFFPMMGVGTAVMTLVGRRIGEGRPQLAVRSTWLAFALTAAYMLAWAAVYLLLPDVILLPFAWRVDPAEFAPLRDQVVWLLRFVALYSFFDGMAIVFGSAIRGAGDTRFASIVTFLTGWLLLVLPTWLAWRWYGGSLMVSWTACSVYIVVLGCVLLTRFLFGPWQSMRVIEAEDVPVPDGALSDRPVPEPVPEG